MYLTSQPLLAPLEHGSRMAVVHAILLPLDPRMRDPWVQCSKRSDRYSAATGAIVVMTVRRSGLSQVDRIAYGFSSSGNPSKRRVTNSPHCGPGKRGTPGAFWLYSSWSCAT